jgi:hypothetical protein
MVQVITESSQATEFHMDDEALFLWAFRFLRSEDLYIKSTGLQKDKQFL